MLALMLSGVVGLASVVFFFSAFFAPKLHRKDDFLWSGFGFFYALVLWICAQRFTGAILLGQLAAVCLLLAFAWQTLRLRAAIANQTIAEVPSFSLLDWVGGGLKRKPKAPKGQPEIPETKEESVKEAAQPSADITAQSDTEDQQPGDDKQSEDKTDETVAETPAAKEDVEKEDTEPVLEPEPGKTPTPVNEVAADIAATDIAEANAPGETAPTPSIPQATSPEAPKPQESKPLKKPKSKLFQLLFRGKQQPAPVSNVAEVIESASLEDEDWEEEEETVEEIVTAVEEAVEEVISPEDNKVGTEETIQVEEIIQGEESDDHPVGTEESAPMPENSEVAIAVAEDIETETVPEDTPAPVTTETAEPEEVEPEEPEETDVTATEEVTPDQPTDEDALEESNWNDEPDLEPEAEENETQAADDPEVPPGLHNDESLVIEANTDPETEESKPETTDPA